MCKSVRVCGTNWMNDWMMWLFICLFCSPSFPVCVCQPDPIERESKCLVPPDKHLPCACVWKLVFLPRRSEHTEMALPHLISEIHPVFVSCYWIIWTQLGTLSAETILYFYITHSFWQNWPYKRMLLKGLGINWPQLTSHDEFPSSVLHSSHNSIVTQLMEVSLAKNLTLFFFLSPTSLLVATSCSLKTNTISINWPQTPECLVSYFASEGLT